MARRIRKGRITTTGTAGSATGNTTVECPWGSVLKAINLDFHASAPGTTDLTIKEGSSSGRTLYTKADSSTDVVWTPIGKAMLDTSGAAVTNSAGDIIVDSDRIWVGLAQCDALTDALVFRVAFD